MSDCFVSRRRQHMEAHPTLSIAKVVTRTFENFVEVGDYHIRFVT